MNGTIRKEMDTLPTDIVVLHGLVRQLLAENAALKAKIAELEARLQADSHNSHQPPSSDGLRKRPALPRPSGRKPGGQPGHPGQTLKMVPHPDHTIACTPEVCACGRSLQDMPGTVIERRQVFDLPAPKLDVTEYQRFRCQCPACGRIQMGHFPATVTAPTKYGIGVSALVTMLNTAYALPFKKIHRLMLDLYGYAVNEQTLITANATCYAALAQSEEVIKTQILASPVCHCDETGIRVAGRLHWQHTASTTEATYLFVHAHRGQQALASDTSPLPAYTGWVVHDCWASYFLFSACQHALCGAHLLRELTALTEAGSRWAHQMHTFLLTLYQVTNHGTRVVTAPHRWSALYDRVCARAHQEEPPPARLHQKGKQTRTKGRNLLDRLIAYKAAVLAFAFHEEVPFTNNQAERDLRPVKVKQKIAGCFRTLVGAQQYARITSFVSTARKQQRHVFKELCRVFQGHSFLLEPTCGK
jgi:transposase